MQKTAVIIPCYNEEKRLSLAELKSAFETYSDCLFLLVNDGSRDGTLRLLEGLSQEHENVDVLDIQPNGGKANAVRKAVLHILENDQTDLVSYFDADLATPLSELTHFQLYFKENASLQMVSGSRIRRLGANINRTWKRHVLGRIFATVASSSLMLPVYDTQCGAKMIRREVAEKLFKESFLSKWLFDVEIFARLSLLNGRNVKNCIIEHPLQSWIEKGESKIRFKDFIKFPLELYKIHRKYHKKIKKTNKS